MMGLDYNDWQWEFGLLPFALEASSREWSVTTLGTARDLCREWLTWMDSNKWVYPPIQTALDREGKELLHLRRSSLLWSLPATHRLVRTDREPRHSDEAIFLIYALGVFFGLELQLADWLITGRVRAAQSTIYIPDPANRSPAATAALEAFSGWFRNASPRHQGIITSACYLHNLVPTYEWDWEQFSWQFAVLEALYTVALTSDEKAQWKKRHSISQSSIPYHRRPQVLAEKYGLASDVDRFRHWSDLRNPLVHEAVWAGTVPGHAPATVDPAEVDQAGYGLRNFCTAVFLSLFGYPTTRLNHEWWDYAPVFI